MLRVKKHASFYEWFWHRKIFRCLRPRIMMMILTLVLPLALLSLVLSAALIHQTIEVNTQNIQNGFTFFVDQTLQWYELSGEEEQKDFVSFSAPSLSLLYWNDEGKSDDNYNGGKIYVCMDDGTNYLIQLDGTWTQVEESFAELQNAVSVFAWVNSEYPFQVLSTFPYHFVIRHMSIWLWVAPIASLLALALCPLLYVRLRKDILEPMDLLTHAMAHFRTEHQYRIPKQSGRHSDEFLHMFDDFNTMAQEVQASYEKDFKLLEIEMDNLRLQINPHMLLNSYNMIYAMAQSHNDATIQEYTLCLVDYFRYVLRQGQRLVKLCQEMDFVENFINIQHIRFPNRFTYLYQAPEECMDVLIPPLLIENFVENAIKYALKPDEPIQIVVSVQMEASDDGGKQLRIIVMDTGNGIRPELLETLKRHEPYVDEAGRRHIGIYNCVRRIELFYGGKGSVRFSSEEGQGTQAYILIPCIYEQEENA